MPREVPFELAGLIEESCLRFEILLKDKLGIMATFTDLKPYIKDYRNEVHRVAMDAYYTGATKAANDKADRER